MLLLQGEENRGVKVEDRDGEALKAVLGGEAGERGPASGQILGEEESRLWIHEAFMG